LATYTSSFSPAKSHVEQHVRALVQAAGYANFELHPPGLDPDPFAGLPPVHLYARDPGSAPGIRGRSPWSSPPWRWLRSRTRRNRRQRHANRARVLTRWQAVESNLHVLLATREAGAGAPHRSSCHLVADDAPRTSAHLPHVERAVVLVELAA